MDYPLASEINIIKDIGMIIPRDRFIDFDLSQLTSDEVYIIERYSMYTFGQELSYNYFSFVKNLANNLDELYNSLRKYNLILAPGDSPSKYILIAQLLGINLPPVVLFPLSGLGTEYPLSQSDKRLLDNYLEEILRDYDINSNTKICLFDYQSSGATENRIRESLKRIFNTEIKLKFIEAHVPNVDRQQEYRIMIEGDLWNKRCQPTYKILENQSLQLINILRCNVIVSLVVLARYHKLHFPSSSYWIREAKRLGGIVRELPKIVLSHISGGKYNAIYYDTNLDEIITGDMEIAWNSIIHDDSHSPISCLISINYKYN